MEFLLALSLVLSMITLVLVGVAMNLAYKALVDIRAMQKSTHSIQYVPADDAWTKEESALNKKLDENLNKEDYSLQDLEEKYDNLS